MIERMVGSLRVGKDVAKRHRPALGLCLNIDKIGWLN